MSVLLGYNHILKIWYISENEVNLIPDLKRQLSFFLKMISIILLIQLSSFILVFSHLNLFWTTGLSIIPTVLFLTYLFFLLLFNGNKMSRLFIAFLVFIISLLNGVLFLLYYFKDEFELLNAGSRPKEDLYTSFKQLHQLLNSEFYFMLFGAIILLFFVIMYSVPFFILNNKSLKLLIQLKNINEQLRKKR